jgi:hypothetical protein
MKKCKIVLETKDIKKKKMMLLLMMVMMMKKRMRRVQKESDRLGLEEERRI